jgi:hypothetical protein
MRGGVMVLDRCVIAGGVANALALAMVVTTGASTDAADAVYSAELAALRDAGTTAFPFEKAEIMVNIDLAARAQTLIAHDRTHLFPSRTVALDTRVVQTQRRQPEGQLWQHSRERTEKVDELKVPCLKLVPDFSMLTVDVPYRPGGQLVRVERDFGLDPARGRGEFV